jgi:hypothetical protein
LPDLRKFLRRTIFVLARPRPALSLVQLAEKDTHEMRKQSAEDVAAEMEAACATHEGRKAFFAAGGSDQAKRQIAALDALRRRFEKFVRA